jgi:thioredoxin 1
VPVPSLHPTRVTAVTKPLPETKRYIKQKQNKVSLYIASESTKTIMAEKKSSFQELVNQSEVPVLVDVFSETCGPCIAMQPVLKDVKQRFGDDLRIIKINGPKNMQFMHDFQIQAFPTLLLFDKGKIVWSRMGYIAGGMLEKMIRSNVNLQKA